MATIKDIAKLSGYSIGTVSRVINDHPDVSDEARKKIKEIIERENYSPNANAKKMKQKSSNVVMILVRGNMNIFFSEALEEVQRNLELAHQEGVVHYIDENTDEIHEALQLVQESKPKGLLFLGGSLDGYDEVLDCFKVPTVLMTNTASSIKSSYVSSFTIDNYDAAGSVISHLYSKGHTKIGVIGGNQLTQIAVDRLQGAKAKMQELGIPFEDDLYEESRFSLPGGYVATRQLIHRRSDISAIFALSDTIAIGCIRCLKDFGYRVPEDISVVGFDGIEFGQYYLPRLSTINQDIGNLSKKAVDDLLFRMHFDKPGMHHTEPFQFIQGETISNR